MTLSMSSSFHCPLQSGADDFLGTVVSSCRTSMTRSRPRRDGTERTLSSQLALTGMGVSAVCVGVVGLELELPLPLPKPKRRLDSRDKSFGGA